MSSSLIACRSLSVVDGRLAGHSSPQVFASKYTPSAVSFSCSHSVFGAQRASKTKLQWASSKSCQLWASPRRQEGVKKVAVMVNASEDVVEEVADEVEEEGASAFDGNFGDNEFLEPPEEAKLYVGNLPFNVDTQSLGELFEGAGNVLDVNLITDRITGNSRGFAFVTMSNTEEADTGIEKFNQYSYEGRILTVRKATPRGTRVEGPQYGSMCRVYVGNLPWQADDRTLLQMFSEHGKVLEARIVYDKDTGRSRGFGFVTYSSENEVNDAISALDGADMDGRPLRVSIAENRPPRRF
ncbi:hypothetical protein KI387_028284 [Taxus chinensis]|uniref:RRM domain-containing protein n=1 Tax=Taxus chinensis TaxID=29808 RepID=A0AA38L484_TAXCH|nr:hypothetical protein KI387_028284 [Taxus chinensis]